MTRAGLPGLTITTSMIDALPAVLRADEFTAQFVGALDEVLAPIVLAIDGLGDYVDPDSAPVDFLNWLASWFDVELDPSWSEERCRETVKRFARLQLKRGTASGLEELIEALTGEPADIDDGGGVWISRDPNSPLEGEARSDVRIAGVPGQLRPTRIVESFVPRGRSVSWE